MKKDELQKENGRLRSKLEEWEREDKRLRTELSAVLRYENGSGYSSLSYTQRTDPMTWIQIAFHMGELRADANYSMLLANRADLERELMELKNPPKQ